MRAGELVGIFKKATKRCAQIGDDHAGVIVGLDLEGRWFGVLDNQVVSKVNAEAILGQCTPDVFLNPGGDGLWPAPEGTTLGYEYATGNWRVPPGLRSARFLVQRQSKSAITIAAEVDLINNQGVGLPLIFGRKISLQSGKRSMTVRVIESITYNGLKPLTRSEALLAPWSLCQFDSGPGCEVVFPCTRKAAVWDLYTEPSTSQRSWQNKFCHTRTDGAQRYQIGIAPEVPWIEFRNPARNLAVRRTAQPLPRGQSFIDIRDCDPALPPTRKAVRYSVYSDPAGFMEIEAAGGAPRVLTPGTVLEVDIKTRFVKI